jgi:hypothetical protein
MQLNATTILPQPLGEHDTAQTSQGASTSRPWTCSLATSW